ncbi:MAG: hypothetical protein L0Y54_15785 [Sporichthyaceae bacterium]|nr:hypothetical protein [Sporichthyaceae bacterium]
MVCPDCEGNGKKLVEVSENGRNGWNKVDCGCNGGYVGLPVNQFALDSPRRDDQQSR